VNCFAQQYPFVQYTPKDGLVNSRVRRIYQDSKGRMYFITFGGLSVYDGTRFNNYTRQEGLANDLVNDVLEISRDTMLIATNINKLNMLVNGKIGTYPVTDHYYPIINRFLKSNDGQIYVAADDGLYILKENKFTRLPVNDTRGNDISLYLDRIIEWKNFFLIIPWDERIEKLILYDKVNRKTTDTYAASIILSMKTNGREVWVTTKSGVKLLDTDSLQYGKIQLTELPRRYAAINNNECYVMSFDKAGNVWTYADNSIRKISPQGTEEMLSSEHGLKTGSLLDLFEDREGIIWMATDGNGVIKMRGSNIQLINSFSPNYSVSASAIQQQEDTIWLYNKMDNSILRVYNNEIRKFQLPFQFRSGALYLQGKRLYIVNDKEVSCIENKDEPSSYRHPRIVVSKSREERLGCEVTDDFGSIIQLTTKSDTNFTLSVFRDNKLMAQHKISFMTDKMIFDREQRLWIAPRDNHVSVFAVHPDQPAHYFELLKDYARELPDIGPRTIASDVKGNIWIGTRYNGVYKLELSGLRLLSIKQFTMHDGLTDNFIYSLACDSSNNVWVGTQSGLDKLFLKDGHYVISNISKSNNFFQAIGSIVITKGNTVWALTSEGSILRVEQASLSDSLVPPHLLLSLLEVNYNPVNDSASDFSYRQNNFTFNVAAPSFFDEKSILYSYQLEGTGNAKWSTPSHNPYITFSNLSPGHYTLHTKAQFPDALYPPQVAGYTFTILPPWWQTWWFRILAGSLIIGLLIIVTRFYYQRKMEQQKAFLEKKQAIEKERTRIATDMHDDLGAGLSRIKFLSETIGMKKQKQLPIEEDIDKIREYSHEMIDKMGEIVWALNEKNDSLSDLLSYTRSYAAEYLSQNGIQCTVNLPEDLSSAFVSGEIRRNIFLAIKEILHNVVKHSQANRVVIEMNVNNGLLIQIQDDGIGFDRGNIRPFSNGLANIEKRMKDIGGHVEIQSTKGTAIKLKMPLSL
jgi:signal transduction histidine kinase